MQILFFIDGNNQNRVCRIKQFLSEFQTFFHKGKPFTMAVNVVPVNVIIVIFPVPGACVIWWIDINAVHLMPVHVCQKLQCMIIVRFNQGMPNIILRTILYLVDLLEIWIDWIPKLRNRNERIHFKIRLLLCCPVHTECSIPINAQNLI